MGSALSSMWFFVSPIPDVSSKGKPKPISAAVMFASCLSLTLALYLAYRTFMMSFPLPPPPPFYSATAAALLCCCCSSSKLVGQARKFAKV